MNIGTPAAIDNGTMDLAGGRFGEIGGWVVLADGRHLSTRIWSHREQAEHEATRLGRLYWRVEIRRLAINVDMNGGELEFYDPTAED